MFALNQEQTDVGLAKFQDIRSITPVRCGCTAGGFSTSKVPLSRKGSVVLASREHQCRCLGPIRAAPPTVNRTDMQILKKLGTRMASRGVGCNG